MVCVGRDRGGALGLVRAGWSRAGSVCFEMGEERVDLISGFVHTYGEIR